MKAPLLQSHPLDAVSQSPLLKEACLFESLVRTFIKLDANRKVPNLSTKKVHILPLEEEKKGK